MPLKAAIFDIDCTLVVTGGAGLRALARSMGIQELPEGYSPHGKTDPLIFTELYAHFHHRSPTETEREHLKRAYLSHLSTEMVSLQSEYRVLPGVRELLDFLARKGVALGIGTGNFEEGARIKLEPGNLAGDFTFGGYGCDAECRNEMMKAAFTRCTNLLGDCRGSECVVIGDTPRDIEAGRAIGAKVIAVATGIHSLDDLREADLAVSDLEDPQVYDFLNPLLTDR